ncbi:CHAD domain-containing protein [Agrococcus sediminis]|uniref:CHAD domain-containing protein n=1 Tax=Agrococcus sediminis TaxID=2599924 RepID=UPI0038241B95
MGDAKHAAGTAGDVVLPYLAAQAEAARGQLPGALRGDHDAVHELRVALRRSRATLQAFRSVLVREQTDALVEELRWLGRELGELRDLQVQEARIEAAIEGLDGSVPCPSGEIGEWFAAAAAEAARRATAALESTRARSVLAAVEALPAHPPRTAAPAAARDALPAAIAAAARRARRRWRHARDLPLGDARDHALHELRKAVKRLRYAAELSAPALGDDAARLTEAAAALQGLLGEHQDSVVTRGVLLELADEPGLHADDGFGLGWLAREQQVRAEALEPHIADAWHSVRQAAKRVAGRGSGATPG